MSRAAVAGFALAVLPLVLTPGASFALTTQRVAAGEARAGWRVAAGTVTGIYVHAVLAALGLSALVSRSATAFTVVRLLGAAYLVGLGLVILLRTVRRSARPAPVRRRLPWAGRSTAAQALLGTVLNPKAAGVYLTLAPQFVDGRQPVLVQLVALATAHAVLQTVHLVGWSVLLGRGRRLVTGARVRTAVDRVTGSVLVGLGVRTAAG